METEQLVIDQGGAKIARPDNAAPD